MKVEGKFKNGFFEWLKENYLKYYSEPNEDKERTDEHIIYIFNSYPQSAQQGLVMEFLEMDMSDKINEMNQKLKDYESRRNNIK